jgi:predicted kinase
MTNIKNNNIIYITCGISGSGKSTWTTDFMKNNPNFLRLNRDDQRLQFTTTLVDYYKRKDLNRIENSITEIQLYSCAVLHYQKFDVILDNTNLNKNYFKPFIDFCNTKDIDFKFKFFDIPLLEAKYRVLARDFNIEFTNMTKSLSNVEYIEKQYQQYNHIKKWILENYPENIYEKEKD